MARLALMCAPAFVLLMCLAPGGSAQMARPAFTIDAIAAPAAALTAAPTDITVMWSYHQPTAAMAPAAFVSGNPQLRWEVPVCDSPDLSITGPLDQEVPLTPTSADVQGTTVFKAVLLGNASAPVHPVVCTFAGRVDGSGAVPPTDTSEAQVPLAVGTVEGSDSALDVAPAAAQAAPGVPLLLLMGGLAVLAILVRRKA